MHVVSGCSDRVVALDHGVKIAEGSFDAVAEPPGGRRGLHGPPPRGPVGCGVSDGAAEPGPASPRTTAQMRILEGISLNVNEGELVCLLGGNASGKSTTLKTILGIVRPRSGRVLLDGQDVTQWPVPQRIADRDRDRAGEPAAVRAADGAGEPRARRGAAPGRVAHRGLRPGARAVPAAARTAQPAGGHAVGRRAADGRDGPGADVTAPAAADGRAVDGAVARAGPAELPDHQDHPRLRGGGPDGRAERDHGAVHRRPRLCPVHRGDRPRGAGAADLLQDEDLKRAYLGR